MSRAFILMLDSFGVGFMPDAHRYGDEGADTLRHIAERCPLTLPNLTRLGLNEAARISQGAYVPGLPTNVPIQALYGCAQSVSLGKDTQSGHWELAGVPVMFDWGYFSPDYPSFPESLLSELIKRAHLPGVLGNKHASGTVIIDELGAEHQATGKPIVYTSADSVFQIAAHETTFGLARLYEVCEIARELVDAYNIGRVIARPFLGEPGHYYRTGNRHDYATPPPALTLLDYVKAAGHEVIAIGKVDDIYAHQGVTQVLKADGNQALFTTFIEAARTAPDQSLTFVNLVDFDMLYGHRRDVAGYARALALLDSQIPAFEAVMKPGDLAILTADHGCDPTWPGSDHTREYVPVLAFGPAVTTPGPIGKRKSFADMGQTLAAHLGLAPLAHGERFG